LFVFLRKSQASDTEEPGKSLFHALKQKLEYRVRDRTSITTTDGFADSACNIAAGAVIQTNTLYYCIF
jgi:hypothetical protein